MHFCVVLNLSPLFWDIFKDPLEPLFLPPQLALRLTTWRPPAPAETGVSSWLSWSRQTVAATTCVKPTMAAAQTLTSSAYAQVCL